MGEKSKQLQEIVRTGVQHMLKLALEAELNQFIRSHNNLVGEDGLKQIVRNGYHRPRSVQCGIGSIEVSVPRSRDRRKNVTHKTVFQSRIIPRYLRKVDALDDLIPDFYLNGLMTGDFSDVFTLLLGENEEILSASSVKWLEEEWKREYYDRYDCHNRDDRFEPDAMHERGWGEGEDGEWYPWIFIGLIGDSGYFNGHADGYGRNKAPAPDDDLTKTNKPTFIATSGRTYGINGCHSGIKPLFMDGKPVQMPAMSTVPKKCYRRPTGKNFSGSFFKSAS
ncbi:MAG: hypothetical protein GY940_04680 [bacterium]|nr:hypothetical protein [bacterium]